MSGCDIKGAALRSILSNVGHKYPTKSITVKGETHRPKDQATMIVSQVFADYDRDQKQKMNPVYYIYIEIRVCPRLGAARADPPLSRMYPQGQCCLGADLAGTYPLTED